MANYDPQLPPDRVLSDEEVRSLERGFRQILSLPDSETDTAVELDNPPMDFEGWAIQGFSDNYFHFNLIKEHENDGELVADHVENCPDHVDGEDLSTIADLGDEYTDLEADLIERVIYTCNLPEVEEELERYVPDRIAFQLISCFDQRLEFTFSFYVHQTTRRVYQDYEYEVGNRFRIPVEPSVDELVDDSDE